MGVQYLNHWNLKEEPFSTVPNPRFFFLSPIHATALGKTEFTVKAKKGLTLVFGDTGTGKSTLARLLHQKFLDQEFNSVLLTNPSYPTVNALLRSIVQEFGLQQLFNPDPGRSSLNCECAGLLAKLGRSNHPTCVPWPDVVSAQRTRQRHIWGQVDNR